MNWGKMDFFHEENKKHEPDLSVKFELALARCGVTQQDAVLLMVSGGSDSTALAYLVARAREEGATGPLAMLHVNHHLRGADSDEDARFVTELAAFLGIPLFVCDVDVAKILKVEGGNMEAVARRERYTAAGDALKSLIAHSGNPELRGWALVAHTGDDRVENFYMRSIVGTGPGGFRSMKAEGEVQGVPVARPLLSFGREELRGYLRDLARAGLAVTDEKGNSWREDATNEDTRNFRAYVRHKIVPQAKARNPKLVETLSRSMDLIGDEDEFLEELATEVLNSRVQWQDADSTSCLLTPEFGHVPRVLQRRAVFRLLNKVLEAQGEGEPRVETASVEAVLEAFDEAGKPRGGYVKNIQGNLVVSANKTGVRIEPMGEFRARRKRVRGDNECPKQ